MQAAVRMRIFLFFLSLIIIPLTTYFVILFAKGYRPSLNQVTLKPTGILVLTSYPDGAQTFINGTLKAATNSTVNLDPGSYEIEIKKEGFFPWKKQLLIEKEIVTRATATLFPTIPILKATTSQGITHPLLSPSGDKTAFIQTVDKIMYLTILEMGESPLGLISREPRNVAKLPITKAANYRLLWSSDSREVLAVASSSATLVNIYTQQVSEASISYPTLLSDWQNHDTVSKKQLFDTLPYTLAPVLATAAADLSWSPNEKKLLYTATASASLPDQIKKPLPGSSSQPQNRTLSPGSVYIFDLEEDRNFQIDQITSISNNGWLWFPSSSHVYKVVKDMVVIKEYDNGNETVIYAGPLFENFAVPYPSGKQFLILTNPTPNLTPLPNLYSINLR